MSATQEKVNISLDRESYDKLQQLKQERFGGDSGVSHSRAIYYAAQELLEGENQ